MSFQSYPRKSAKGIPPRLPQDVIDEIANRPRDKTVTYHTGIKCLDDIINHGKTFEGGYPALLTAQDYAQQGGFIATMPQIIAARAIMTNNHWLWNNEYSSLTEEIWIESPTRLPKMIMFCYLVLHGGGFVNPKMSEQWYDNDMEIDKVFKGELPNGEHFELYTVKDVIDLKVKDPFGRYGVLIARSELVKGNVAYSKEEFLKNPITLARAGTPEYLENYYSNCSTETVHADFIANELGDTRVQIACAMRNGDLAPHSVRNKEGSLIAVKKNEP